MNGYHQKRTCSRVEVERLAVWFGPGGVDLFGPPTTRPPERPKWCVALIRRDNKVQVCVVQSRAIRLALSLKPGWITHKEDRPRREVNSSPVWILMMSRNRFRCVQN